MTSPIGAAETSALSASLRRSIGEFVRATRARSDSLPQSRAEILRALARSGPRSMAALAASRGVSHQTVSRMVADMEALGLVTRGPDPGDARAFLIAISGEGRDRVEADLRAREDRIAEAIASSLTSEQQRSLAGLPDLLDLLTAAIDEAGAHPRPRDRPA